MKNVIHAYPSDSAIKTIKHVLVSIWILLIEYDIQASTFYVSPDADTNGTGTFSYPWQFQHALNHPSTLQPGDTVYLKGGVYKNNYSADISFFCNTKGAPNKPIVLGIILMNEPLLTET